MSELTRQERFSMSRQFAKELVADSIITDAAAQFLALMIEEIHNTKIAPLQAEIKRRTTLSAAMQLPEVQALVEAARKMLVVAELREIYHRLPNDKNRIGDPKSPKAKARDAWLKAFRRASSATSLALAAIKDPKI